MSNSTIIVLIAVAIVITIAVLDFLSRYKEEKKRRISIEENKKLYVSSWSDRKPRYNLKHQGVYVFNIPFIPDKKEVFYLEDEYDKEANEFIRGNIDYIKNKLAAKGMSFIYLVMEPLVKTVYIFFLRHPEGILFKDLPDYRVEMEFIYRAVKGRENDVDRQLASSISPKISPNIEAVTDPTKNSINEKCSRIRNAFVSHFHDCIAQNYYIQGSKSFAKLITLPRNKVTWEDNGNGK